MVERNGLKTRLDHIEKRLEAHLASAGSRFDEMSEFRGNIQARITSLEDAISELKHAVRSQTSKLERISRKVAYYAGALAVGLFLINIFSPTLANLFTN